MSKAEEINKIHFARNAYFFKNKDSFMASNSQDMEDLRKQLVALSLLTSMTSGGIISDYDIPKDPAQRAEDILSTINIIVHRYPFPKAVDGNSGSFSQFRPEPIIFTDFDYLEQWVEDIGTVITILKPVTAIAPLFYPEYLNSYLNALTNSENEKKAKGILPEKILGESNPYVIFNDFINGMAQVKEVYYSNLFELNRAKQLQSTLLSKTYLSIVLLGGFVIFIIGVFLPLSAIQLNPFYYLYFPLVYYTFIFLMIIIKIACY